MKPLQSDIAALFAAACAPTELNGTTLANTAVADANARGGSIIFLTRTVYQDLCYRANLPELARYKGKAIWITSDPIA